MIMFNNHAYDDDDEMGDLDTFDFDAPGIRCLVQSTLWGDLDFASSFFGYLSLLMIMMMMMLMTI